MQRFILFRFGQALVTIWLASVVVFGLARLTGSPLELMLPVTATEEDYARMSAKLGLDKPLPLQYGIWLSNALQGDLGKSIRFSRPAVEIVLERLPATLELGTIAFLLALILAIPIGVYAAKHRGTRLDNVARGFAVVGQSVPHFVTGIFLILFFAVWLRLLPASGKGGVQTFILPSIVLGYLITAGIMRITRSAMLEVLDAEYVKLARSKGLPEFIVTWKHAFKNAALTVLTFATLVFVRALVGSVVTETVFAWPGIGRLAIESVTFRDYAIIQTVVLIMAIMWIMGNLVADILYAYINPKIRY